MADSAWTEERLLRMIEEQIRETSELDYKRSAALARTDVSKNELSKDVSAFANAGGGTLIYGIAEDEKRHVPERLDDGIDPSIITKEWLEDVISSSIHRKIDGVRIHVVPLTAGRVGRVSYVVEVPQSMRAPHMASDHKYYKRHNFKSEPMEEYECEMLHVAGLRRSFARLRLHVVCHRVLSCCQCCHCCRGSILTIAAVRRRKNLLQSAPWLLTTR